MKYFEEARRKLSTATVVTGILLAATGTANLVIYTGYINNWELQGLDLKYIIALLLPSFFLFLLLACVRPSRLKTGLLLAGACLLVLVDIYYLLISFKSGEKPAEHFSFLLLGILVLIWYQAVIAAITGGAVLLVEVVKRFSNAVEVDK